ncbi:N-acetyltransferase GCN5 [Cellulomonas chitinilytica]|uniref:N-acetyltransferase GCN5 n=1 Tax=Cellulomonas chitinilytica TaxID=398759 RepID=A0A919P570_9CELL|nr:GNAT family N-acetyltransferase [Cellulomonas chitinilytica]GIG22352.1 N-acetyltransferase GCN5 [Cellulomonas chitinilytica]
MAATRTDLVVEPLTPERWPVFEELMDAGGPAARCWCMAWRIGPGYRRRPAEENRADMRDVVRRGPPPGLLAFDGDGVAVGWCQVTPRAQVPEFGRQWRLRPVDDVPVWAITCFYVRTGRRRAGVMRALVDAAVDLARRAGAPAVEAYPLDAARSPSATSTGYATTFAAAGFVEVTRRSPERPIMRLPLDDAGPAGRRPAPRT